MSDVRNRVLFRQLAPPELAARLRAPGGPGFRLVDVREAHEWEIARIEGAQHLPLSEVRTWWRSLDPDVETVFCCHHGRRSSALCRALAAEGFTRLGNLTGGIEAWRSTVDPTMPAY